MAIFSSIYTFVQPPTSALQHKPRANTQAGSSSSSNLLDLRVLLHIIAASCAARACETMINGLHNINTSNENRALRARTHAHHGTNNKDTHMICAKYHTHTTKRSSQHNTTQHNTTQHNTTQHNTTQHNTTQHNTTQHNTTQHNTTQHNTTQRESGGSIPHQSSWCSQPQPRAERGACQSPRAVP
jgi:hypothetical protein